MTRTQHTAHLITGTLLSLQVAVLGLPACSSSHAGPDLCTTADEHALAAGESVPDDRCQVCDATTGVMLPRWHEGCGNVVEHTYSPADVTFSTYPLRLGGDVNHDGIQDLLSANRSRLSGVEHASNGFLNVLSVKSGDLIYRLEGTADSPIGGALDLGGDVDADGRADLLFTETAGTFAGGLDVDGGPDEPHGAPNVVHVRSIAPGEDIWTLAGPGGCHALGAAGRFVPDYDGDGIADVLLLDPGCVAGHTSSGRDFGSDSSDMSGSLELHSGRDGTLIRAWSRSEGVGVWGDGGVYPSLDQDGDGKAEFLVLSGRSAVGSPEVEVFSMQSDVPIARWHPDPETRLLVGPTSGTYLASDLTGDGDPNIITVEGIENGQILVTVLGQLDSPRPTHDAFSFRVPGGSHTRHVVWYYGHGDVDGDGTQDIMILDHDRERGNSEAARLLAVTLQGRVLWLSPHDTLRGSLVGDGVVDLDGDGRVDFVSAGPGFSTIHLDLSTGFGEVAP